MYRVQYINNRVPYGISHNCAPESPEPRVPPCALSPVQRTTPCATVSHAVAQPQRSQSHLALTSLSRTAGPAPAGPGAKKVRGSQRPPSRGPWPSLCQPLCTEVAHLVRAVVATRRRPAPLSHANGKVCISASLRSLHFQPRAQPGSERGTPGHTAQPKLAAMSANACSSCGSSKAETGTSVTAAARLPSSSSRASCKTPSTPALSSCG